MRERESTDRFGSQHAFQALQLLVFARIRVGAWEKRRAASASDHDSATQRSFGSVRPIANGLGKGRCAQPRALVCRQHTDADTGPSLAQSDDPTCTTVYRTNRTTRAYSDPNTALAPHAQGTGSQTK
jgi:hypothetical protein